MNQSISAVVLTKNEEKNIERCITSLGWCDEIIIVDDFSEDTTINRIQNHDKLISYYSSEPPIKLGENREVSLNSSRKARTIKIFKRHLNGDFAMQRNFGLEKANGEWVLFVDADERISSALAEEIQCQMSNVKSQMCNGYFIRRKDYFGGKWLKYGETANVRLLRMGRKGKGRWVGKVHEVWEVEGKTEEFKNPILHYPHPTVSEFLKEVNIYTDIVVQCWKEEGRKISFWEIPVYPMGKFLQNYLFRLGFLDGTPGLIMAIFMSFHSFLARSKYWLTTNF